MTLPGYAAGPCPAIIQRPPPVAPTPLSSFFRPYGLNGSLLQDRFRTKLAKLEEWEQTLTLATLQRIASMMEAEDLEAAPVLVTGSVEAPGAYRQPKGDKTESFITPEEGSSGR